MIRIGILIPNTNTTVENDFQKAATADMSIHSQRLRIPEGEMTAAFLDQMNDDLDDGIPTLAASRVNAMAYCCTSGSFYKGPGWDRSVMDKIQKATNIHAIATSPAVLEALHKVGAKTLSVATPYPDWANEKLQIYLENIGFKVLKVAGDVRARAGGHTFINDQEPQDIAEFVVETHHPDADTIFCSCTAWRTLEAIPAIESATGKKVITSNQATIWATFNALGLSMKI